MADQDFEKLLSTIKQINAEMQELTAKIAKARQEMAAMGDPAQRVAAGRQIGGYQTALTRKAAQSSELASQSMTEIKNQKIFSSVSQTDIERRLNLAALGVPLTTAEIMAKGRETAKRVLSQQQQLLREAQTSVKTNIIPQPGGPAPRTDVDDDFPNITRTSARGASAQQRAELERKEKELVESLKVRLQAEKRYVSVLQQMEKAGFTLNDLKFGRTKGSAGVEQFRFSRRDTEGVNQELDLYNTRGGRTTPGIGNQFRSFGQGVLRDVGELTKWSLALAAVYGPLQKLQELTQIMIQNQTQLAEAAITVSSAFLDQNDIFDIAADQAERAGESISGVIDAFTQAYRATGGAGNQVERLATSQKLLSDSLILAKLSSLDQAGAIDTLSAALRQSSEDGDSSNEALGRGTELLDKWVRVTKIANIDLASLATGFAVLGDAADAAQISTDQLNGILAAIGETGVSSGRELANTARAIVAGFQSDQAREAIEGLGIAFEDSQGQARPFLDIMQEISSLRISGAIDDTQFSKLTLALGGGTRRQAAYATFIENFGRVGEVAAESAKANGDAQAALAKQLDTVQTSLTRLGNAFQELAQTLGTEGGFLGLITSGVNGLTGLVKVFDDLTGMLGKATPALLAFIAATAVLKYQGRGSIQQTIGGLAGDINPEGQRGLSSYLSSGSQYARPTLRGTISQDVLGTNALSGGIQGALISALPAILNFTNKEDKYGSAKGTANIIGGVGGGIIGSLTGAGPIIGATIGTAISEAFVSSTIARRTDIFGYNAPTFGEPGAGKQTSADLDEALTQAESELYKSIGLGSEAWGKLFTAGSERAAESFIEQINKAIETQDEGRLKSAYAITGQSIAGQDTLRQLEQIGLGREAIEGAFKNRQQIQFDPQYLAFQQASPEAQSQFRAAESARLAEGGTPQDQKTAFSGLLTQNKELYSQLLSNLKESSKERISQERISGDIKGAEYARRSEAISGFDVKALQYYTALGNEVDKLTGGADDAAKQFEILNNVIISGSDESIPQITTIAGEIQTLVNLLDDPALNEDRLSQMFGDTNTLDIANEKLDELRKTLANIISDSNKDVLLGRLDIPDVQGDINKPLTQEEFGQVSQTAKKLQDQFYSGFLQIPDDMYDALKGSWDEWAQIVEDSGQTFFQTVSEIDPQFFQQAMAKLIEEGKLASQQASPFGIQQLDITSGQGAGLQGSIDYFSGYLAQNFPQYEQKPEEFGVIFSDYVTDVLHGDNLAVKLALEKLVDINQKQLDGMYNIPEGATFWVPLQAAYYRPKNEEGAGAGLPAVDSAAVTGNTSATDRNTSALLDLATAMNLKKEQLDRGVEDMPGLGKESDKQLRQQRLVDRFRGTDVEKGNLPALTQGQLRAQAGRGTNRAEDVSGFESFIQKLKDAIQNLFPGGSEFPTRPGGYGQGANVGGSRPQFSPTQQPQAAPINAKLDFRFDNTTTLLVDGRVLASVITPYLASDLLRLEASQGTITRRYVI